MEEQKRDMMAQFLASMMRFETGLRDVQGIDWLSISAGLRHRHKAHLMLFKELSVSLLMINEAARVTDAMYKALRPMSCRAHHRTAGIGVRPTIPQARPVATEPGDSAR